MIDPNTGMPMQGGADGNKEFDAVISHNMEKRIEGNWHCVLCDFSSKKTSHVRNHIESKHFQDVSFPCDMCPTVCPTRNALSMHVLRKHKHSSSNPPFS